MLDQKAPSRFINPFATCWTRPGALQFRFPSAESAQQLLAKLASQNWRGAIVGPHGSGKSTLLAALKPLLSEAGCTVIAVALRDRQRQLPRAFVESITSLKPNQNGLLVLDGFEQLGWKGRVRLAYISRRSHTG